MYKVQIEKQDMTQGIFDTALLALLVCICNKLGETDEALRILESLGIKYLKKEE